MATEGLYFRFAEDGSIISYGIELPDAVFIAASDLPADIMSYTHQKFVWNGSALVVRAGWVDPVISEEPEVPAEPETPADPE